MGYISEKKKQNMYLMRVILLCSLICARDKRKRNS